MSKRQWKCRRTIVFQLFYLRLSEIALTNAHTHICMHAHACRWVVLPEEFVVVLCAYDCILLQAAIHFIWFHFLLLLCFIIFVVVLCFDCANAYAQFVIHTYIHTNGQTDRQLRCARGSRVLFTLYTRCILSFVCAQLQQQQIHITFSIK